MVCTRIVRSHIGRDKPYSPREDIGQGEYITEFTRHASLTRAAPRPTLGPIRYTEVVMTKTEHLQFLVLMIPTILILVAAAVCMADLEIPAEPTYRIVSAYLAAEE